MSAIPDLTRRDALRASAAASGVLLLAGCGSDDAPSPAAAQSAAGQSPATGSSPSASASATATPSAAAGGKVVALADVPVGGSVGAEVDGKPVLLAQPKAGSVVCFSAKCTHKGCTVKAAGAQLKCPCHGSVYDAATGKVLGGPAPAPLAPVAVRVEGTEVVTT